MLVKFGELSKPVKEYCLEDNATLEDLLEAADVDPCGDDMLQESFRGSVKMLNIEDNIPLKEGSTYILTEIKFTSQEEKIVSMLSDEWYPDDMSIQEQKDFIKKLFACGWDK
jgi:hypothetical protein